MKHILFKKLSYNFTRIALSVLASIAVMITVTYAASTVGTNFSADGTLSVTATSTLSSDLRVDTNTLVVDSFNDRVGVGTTSPYAKLSVAGEVVGGYFTATSTTATSTFAGGMSITGTGTGLNFGSDTLFYQNSQRFLTSSTTAAGNLTFGYQSPTGIDANGGLYNTGVGYQALGNATSTGYNTALGYQALKGSATISNTGENTAVGYQALTVNTTGVRNSAFGRATLDSNTTGNNNTAIGVSALQANNTGNNNVAIGYAAFQSNTSGIDNTVMGVLALSSNSTNNQNTAIGRASLLQSTGTGNTGLGFYSGYGDGTTQDQRSVIDNYATFIGYQASRSESVASTSALTNITAIGKKARVAQSNAMVLGGTGSDAVDVAIGTTSPWAKLSIQNTYGSPAPLFDIASSTSAAYATSSMFRVNANGNVGIGTTSPNSLLHVSAGASATTTVEFGAQSTSAKTCFNIRSNTGAATSFYFVGTTMVVEANACR